MQKRKEKKMAKKIDMEAEFKTLPDLPEGFKPFCYSLLSPIRIYYRRHGKTAECICGKCGKEFATAEIPVRGGKAACPHCGNKGIWEWKRITREWYESYRIAILQRTMTGNIAARLFLVDQWYGQDGAKIRLEEEKRWFMHMGDVYKFNNEDCYTSKGWKKCWSQSAKGKAFDYNHIYPGWKKELEKSNLKYCDVERITRRGWAWTVDAIATYANNPAVEMYAKAGMSELVEHMLERQGQTKLINRRAKTPLAQLRLQEKAMLNRLIKGKGDPALLEVLQYEKKTGVKYTEEQERFLARIYVKYRGRENLDFLLRYMSLTQLMNRLDKYREQGSCSSEHEGIQKYTDYLKMRMELEYDMTNELYIHPRNLKEKHDKMVRERNAKRDKDHVAKMKAAYPDIEKRYKKLCKKYSYEEGEYLIRPAKDAGEIVMEGRNLHHCVGGNTYLGRHNNGESSILFIRKKENPEEPYYTIEIRKNEIVQWYGARDSKPDKEVIEPWLEDYMEYLKGKRRKGEKVVAGAA